MRAFLGVTVGLNGYTPKRRFAVSENLSHDSSRCGVLSVQRI